MDEKNSRGPGRTAEGMDEATRRSYRAAVDRAFDMQRSNVELSRTFFESWLQTLEEGAELNRRALGEAKDLVRWQQEVLGELSRDSLAAYGELLGSLSARGKEVSRGTEGPER